MRCRIMVISHDAALRARFAQLLTRSGYRAEVAESAAEARRAGLDGVALVILASDGLRREYTVAVEELRAAVGRTTDRGASRSGRGKPRLHRGFG
jgi:DNA-binding response OmpR family regulator